MLALIQYAEAMESSLDLQNLSLEPDSTVNIDEEFTDSRDSDIDYDALARELYGTENGKEPDQISREIAPATEKPARANGKAPGLFFNSGLNGSHLSLNISSPFAVSAQLSSWHSYVDAGITFMLPYEVYVESIPLYILIEISNFSFENSYPEGGDFSGLSYVAQASSIGENAGATLGFGFWNKSLGSMVELNYRLRPTRNTFFRLGTRGVLITNVEPLGNTWWLELRVSMGLEL